MMIHDLDMARFLLGEEPVEVFAVGSCAGRPAIGAAGDVDTAAVLLKTASGKIAQISNSRRATYGYDQRIEVHGAKGMLRAGNVHATTVELATAARASAPIPCRTSSSSATPPPTAPNSTPSSTPCIDGKAPLPQRRGRPQGADPRRRGDGIVADRQAGAGVTAPVIPGRSGEAAQGKGIQETG